MSRARFLTLALTICIPIAAQTWPMYLKDLTHSSFVSSETQLNQNQISNLQRTWDLSVGAPLASAVTVSNGVLYFGDWSGYFHAVNAQTGTELWKTFVGKAPDPEVPDCDPGIGVTSQATLIGNIVYVGGGDSAVYALDRSTGNQIWRVSLADPASGSYIWSSIVPYQNALYVGVASLGDCPLVRGAVVRIDPSDPQQPLFSYLMDPDETGAGVWTTPAIDASTNTIFLNTGNGDIQDVATGNWSEALLALDATTLTVKASFLLPADEVDADLDWGSSPTLFTPSGGVPMVAATGKDGFLYALQQSDLSLVWKTQIAIGCVDPQAGCGSLSTPAFDGATLFVGGGVRDSAGDFNGSLWAIRPSDGSVIWVRDLDGPVIAPVTVANGLVFVCSTTGFEIFHAATGQLLWHDRANGAMYSQPVVVDGTVFTTYISGEAAAWAIPPATSTTLYSFSGASFLSSLAPGAIASVFGSNLQGASVTVEDGAGTLTQARVTFSSAGQINYLVPDDAATGRGAVTVTTSSGDTLSTALQISDVAPGVFSANGNAKGVAAAQAVLIGPDGSQQYVSVARCGTAPGSCVAQPINVGTTTTGQAVLILYGTGIRGFTSLDNVRCTIGGVSAPILYAGPQNTFAGLDQVNIQLPVELAGRGEVDVTLWVDGQLSNTVTVSFQ
jgi:polyvinyl alcohol dehydrogenase (cytochrome)